MPIELVHTFAVLGAVFGALISIDKILDLIKKYKKPSDNIHEMLLQHDRDISKLKDCVNNQTRMTNKAMLQIMNHMIDGNHTDKLIAVRDELQDYLINH